MGRHLAVLYLTQLVFGALTFLALPWPWLSLVLPAGYLAVVLLIALDLRRSRTGYGSVFLLAMLWQAPGLLGSLANLGAELGLVIRIDILDFLMQTWHMPLLPWVVQAPAHQWRDAVLYYWALTLVSPVLVAGMTALQQTAPSTPLRLDRFRPGSFSSTTYR